MNYLSLTVSAVVSLATLSMPALAANETWKINSAGSSVKFSVKNLGLPVSGHFNDVTGEVHYDGKHLEGADIKSSIEIASIDTGIGRRDHHLQGKDFFNVSQFPQAVFESSKIETQPDGSFLVIGKLTLHGVVEEIKLDAKPLRESADKSGQKHLTSEATADLKRKDFGIGGGLTAATISNAVTVNLVMDLTK
jgi:polyisoprenoid-binding protein YceI